MLRSSLALSVTLFFSSELHSQSWKVQTTGADTNLRGVSAAYFFPGGTGKPNQAVVWASGSNGAVLRSVDDGKTWTRIHVEGGAELDFRGIVAVNDKIAYLMSSGEGGKSRIYKTTDAGQTWELQYTDQRKPFFLDAIACSSETNCFALSDPLDGKFLILRTQDGKRWQPLPVENLPSALPAEGAFAASNTALAIFSNSEIFFVTGGSAARLFHSTDLGKTWNISKTSIAQGTPSSGIFSMAILNSCDKFHAATMVLVGGDYTKPASPLNVDAYSSDAGKTWLAGQQQPTGYRSAVASLDPAFFIAVGPNGSDDTSDSGAHWTAFSSLPLNAIFMLDHQHVYAAGPNGTVVRFVPAESR